MQVQKGQLYGPEKEGLLLQILIYHPKLYVLFCKACVPNLH